MAMKSITLITVLVVVLAATQAKAQRLPAIRLFNITGNVFCSVNGSIAVNGTGIIPPPFPNALVQLSCNGILRGLAITNRAGTFNIVVSPIQVSLNNLLSSCRLVVATPLSNCNVTLPSNGTLQAPIQLAGTTVIGLLINITQFVAGVFRLIGA
ncbi:putative phylloplanin [Helianthus annuus]|nr:putative phylloplanin [Helianthus annuus]